MYLTFSGIKELWSFRCDFCEIFAELSVTNDSYSRFVLKFCSNNLNTTNLLNLGGAGKSEILFVPIISTKWPASDKILIELMRLGYAPK